MEKGIRLKSNVFLGVKFKPINFSSLRQGIWEWLYLLWMGVLPSVVSLSLSWLVYQHLPWFQALDGWAYLGFWLVGVLMLGLALCPTTFFSLFTGFVFGWKGLLPMLITYTLAAILGYVMAKRLGGQRLMQSLKTSASLQVFFQSMGQYSAAWVMMMRLSPILPFALSNALLAFLRIPVITFLWAGTLGMLPRSLLAWWMGSKAKDWWALVQNPGTWQWTDVLGLGLFLLSMLGMLLLIQAAKRGLKA